MHFAVSSLRGKLGGLYACGATFRYNVPLPNIFLTRLFSKTRLKRKDFQEIARLAWAQEVSGSNPDAPTKLLLCFQCTVSETRARTFGLIGSVINPKPFVPPSRAQCSDPVVAQTSLTIPSENLQHARVSGTNKIQGRQATLWKTKRKWLALCGRV